MDKQKILHPKNIGAYTLILSTTFLLNAVSAQNVVADENSSTATIIQPLKAENANDLSKEISTTVNHVEEKNTDTSHEKTENSVASVNEQNSTTNEVVIKDLSETNKSVSAATNIDTIVKQTQEAETITSTQTTTDIENEKEEFANNQAAEVNIEKNESEQLSSATPQNIDSNTIISVPKTWEAGYKGEGMVVAIIDSGIDVDHDVLHITNPDTSKYNK